MQSQEEWEAGGYHPGVGCKLKGGGSTQPEPRI